MNEIWKQCDVFKMYEASSLGRLRKGERIIKAHTDPAGYLMVGLYTKPCAGNGVKGLNKYPKIRVTTRVHRLVASAFHGKCPDGLEVNHKDGNKQNNCPENLEYITHADNLAHARNVLGKKLGFKPGAGHPFFGKHLTADHRAKMSAAKMGNKHWRCVVPDLGMIAGMLESGSSFLEVMRATGLKKTTIGDIFRGSHWSLRNEPELRRRILVAYAGRETRCGVAVANKPVLLAMLQNN